ncbi:MAG: hypothetical protein ABSF61_02390 [Anaerolineales bacterium]
MGSSHLISVHGKTLLLDSGLCRPSGRQLCHQLVFRLHTPPRDLPRSCYPTPMWITREIAEPCAEGFRGPIHATTATVHLTERVLWDAGLIQEKDIAFLNK